MLNKVILEGKVLPFDEKKKDNSSSFYFNLLVPCPNKSLVVVRCLFRSKINDSINKINIVKSNNFINVEGFLRIENFNNFSKQLTIVIVKIEESVFIPSSEKEEDKINSINLLSSNKVKLLGVLINDMEIKENKRFSQSISFKISVPKISTSVSSGDSNRIFFCRATGEIIEKLINEPLLTNDLVFVEGFIQTKKVESNILVASENINNFIRISSIVCQKIVLIDNVFNFNKRINGTEFKVFSSNIEKITFEK